MKPLLQSKRFVSSSVRAGFYFTFLLLILSFSAVMFINRNNADEVPPVFSAHLASPVFSHTGGFYNENVRLELSHPSPDALIFYTTDGSVPGINAQLYSEPLIVKRAVKNTNPLSEIPTSPRWKPPLKDFSEATIIRAVAITPSGKISKELANTFFVNPNGSDKTLPVVSLIAEKDDLFGFKKGIYIMGKGYEDKDNYVKKNIKLNSNWWDYPANFKKKGRDWERPVHVQFFDPKGKILFSENAGIRIHGSATRAYSQKSLRLMFRKYYGKASIDYDIFGDNPNYVFSSLILRNSGNDWDKTMFRDLLMHSLLKESRLDLQNYLPVVVYINGEYWGIHNIREYFDEYYFMHKYKINLKQLTFADLNSAETLKDFHLSEIIDFVKKNDLSSNVALSFVNERMDIENFIDYTIAHIFFGNSDWPGNNVKLWKKITTEYKPQADYGHDGRWRFLFFDSDYGFGFTGNPDAFKINMLEKAQTTGVFGTLFQALMKNEKFKEDFIKRFEFHLDHTFNSEKLLSRINHFEQIYAGEMEQQISRWRKPERISDWKANVEVLREFAVNRHIYQRKHLEQIKK
jgi:hypothetical protein